MKNFFLQSFLNLLEQKNEVCFLTGDLGFAFLEPIRKALGNRFINAGIAEQNMMSVAAGLCRAGMDPWVYSISPFCYARPFEQVRNDICLHDLPVKIIGSGGGFGYGLAGPSHHALEDCGVMSSLQNMVVYAPSFPEDIPGVLHEMKNSKHPCYLRLARAERNLEESEQGIFQPFRRVAQGEKGVVVALGTMASVAMEANDRLDASSKVSVWACSKMPLTREIFDNVFVDELCSAKWVLALEDHVRVGGLGEQFASVLMENNIRVRRYVHRYASGYISGLYGSQDFHRKENGIDAGSLLQVVADLG